MPKKKYTGTCIYCGHTGKMSKEHVFSNWLGELFEKDQQRNDAVLAHTFGKFPPKVEVKKVSGAIHTRKEPVVCENCNNNWMSTIVENAKPIESRLVASKDFIEISGDDQIFLKKKIALTAMTMDSVHTEKNQYLAEEDRYDFKNSNDLGAFDSVCIFNICDSENCTPWADTACIHLKNEKNVQILSRPIFKSLFYVFGCMGVFAIFRNERYSTEDILREYIKGNAIELYPEYRDVSESGMRLKNSEFRNIANGFRGVVTSHVISSYSKEIENYVNG